MEVVRPTELSITRHDAIPLFLSIIGIPMGIANLKLIPISLLPLGTEVVSTDRPFAESVR